MTGKQPRRAFLVNGLKAGATLALAGSSLPCCMLQAMAADVPPTTPDGKKQRSLEELGYCGFECETECDVYQATLHNNLAEKTKIADRWNKRYGVSIKPADVACDGCRSQTGRLGYHCGHICEVRKCGRSRRVPSCAACADFPTCDKELWKNWTAMRQRTEKRHREMQTGA